MFFLIFSEFFIAFPDRKDAIVAKNAKSNNIEVESSGSLGIYSSKQCHKTYPNLTISENKELEWCSNIADKSKGEQPWIMYSIRGKAMKLTGFAIRNGCCYHSCCCDESGKIVNYGCCCTLYTFSLHGSNDKKNWKLIHRVEKEKNFWGCKFMTFEIKENTESYKYLKIVLDEPYPNCPFCMQLNQVEFYGETRRDFSFESYDAEENDDSVSIIGKVKRDDE